MKTTCKIIKQTETNESFSHMTEKYTATKSVEWYLELKFETSKENAVYNLMREYNLPTVECPDTEEENGIITYTDGINKDEYDSEIYKKFKKELGKI